MTNTPHPEPTRFHRLWPGLSLVVIIFLAGSVLYWIKGDGGKEASQDCLPASETVKALSPLAKGTIAALTFSSKPKPATPVTFEGPDGKALSISDFKGKSLVLNLWATWCGPCHQELPLLSDYAAKHADRGLRVLGFSLDEPAALPEVREMAAAWSFPVGLLGSAYAGGYGRVWRIPVNFTIDRNGLLADNGWDSREPAWTTERLERIVTPLLR